MAAEEPRGGAAFVVHGEPGPEGILLSLCIPTYNRARKLERLLRQLAAFLPRSGWMSRVEVVIADNASTDDTAAVCDAFAREMAPHGRVRIRRQPVNVGMMRNFQFLYEEAHGEYVCIWGDDDELVEKSFGPLLDDLRTESPEVAISSFVNFGSEKDQVQLAGGARTAWVRDLDDAVAQVFALGKITQYVLRRRAFTPEEQAVSDEAVASTEFWFVTIALVLYTRHAPRMLLRADVIARSDDEVANLRFSPMVYATMKRSVLLGLPAGPVRERAEATMADSSLDSELLVVAFLFRHCVGRLRLDPDVAEHDYRFVRANLVRLARHSWRNLVKLPVILASYPVVRRTRR